jgi:hypothetical protein
MSLREPVLARGTDGEVSFELAGGHEGVVSRGTVAMAVCGRVPDGVTWSQEDGEAGRLVVSGPRTVKQLVQDVYEAWGKFYDEEVGKILVVDVVDGDGKLIVHQDLLEKVVLH